MIVIKCVFVLAVYVLPFAYQQELPTGPDIEPDEIITSTTESFAETTPIPIKPANDYPKPPFSSPKPGFVGNKPSPQNILHKLFTQFLRPIKVSGKTYGHGPNVVAIIGDKPYISLEVFNKFSPFKWLISAFQGKIQNVCQFLAPSAPDDFNIPSTMLNEIFEENLQQKPPGSKQQFQEYGPIRMYNIPSQSKNIKLKF